MSDQHILGSILINSRIASAVIVSIILSVVVCFQRRWRSILPPHFKAKSQPWKVETLHLVIVLGSGGHTREMQSILADLDPIKFGHRTYIISSGDDFSAQKARECEKVIQARCHKSTEHLPDVVGKCNHELESTQEPQKAAIPNTSTGMWDIQVVSRARQVFQPVYTAPFSSLRCLFDCIQILLGARRNSITTTHRFPDVIITNGPGTGFIVVLASVLLKFFAIAPVHRMRVLFVESWARPYKLSLTGRLLLTMGFCDKFIVQWKAQAAHINRESCRKRVEYKDFMLGLEEAQLGTD